MDYLYDAFGGFDPQGDEDAALKFSLNVLMLDNRVADLLKLIQGRLGGVEGVPGWIIERRDDGEVAGYENWPEGSLFRAYVDPFEYALAHPEFYADVPTFMRYARAILTVYERRHSECLDGAEEILKDLARYINAG